jgi:hypothetical protein
MDYIYNSWKSYVFFCALCTTRQFCANLVSHQCIWSELSTSFHPGFLSGHSRMSVLAPGSGSQNKCGFKGTLLGAVTMVLFIKIVGRQIESHPILPSIMASSNNSPNRIQETTLILTYSSLVMTTRQKHSHWDALQEQDLAARWKHNPWGALQERDSAAVPWSHKTCYSICANGCALNNFT